MADTIFLTALIFAAALLYSSVGHAGASGYLASMALFGLPQAVMRPSALMLNIFVASIGTYRFYRAGHFSWRLFWPFAVASVPLAFVGGRWKLSDPVYQKLLAGVLVVAALNLIFRAAMVRLARADEGQVLKPPPLLLALLIGAGIGLLSGMTGVGGGIFLSPLLLLFRWADPKRTAAVSAAFILVNSISGLAGQIQAGQFGELRNHITELAIWIGAAVIGGSIGSWLGARKFDNMVLRLLLAAVLIIAGAKMMLT